MQKEIEINMEELGEQARKRATSMTDEERVEFAKNLKVEDYREIPEYWKEHLEERIQKIHERQIAVGSDGTSFGLVGDFHFTCNTLHAPALLEKILEECAIPYFIQGGDIVSGMGVVTPENLIREIVTVRKLFHRIESKMLLTIGNHDPAYSLFPGEGYAQSLTKEQLYEYMFRFQAQYPGRVFGPAGTYFYADDVCHKMRYVILNSHDTPTDELKEDGRPIYPKMWNIGMCQEQIDWFAHTALKVPDAEWTVVICTHEPYCLYGENHHHNRSLLLGIIDAFRKHTSFEGATDYPEKPGYSAKVSVDFTGAGGNFAAWVGGHYHQGVGEYEQGILCISPFSDGFRSVGNTEEQSFDIVTVDKKNHRLYLTQVGFGMDREFDYEVY